jgi:hypothetical protein
MNMRLKRGLPISCCQGIWCELEDGSVREGTGKFMIPFLVWLDWIGFAWVMEYVKGIYEDEQLYMMLEKTKLHFFPL